MYGMRDALAEAGLMYEDDWGTWASSFCRRARTFRSVELRRHAGRV